MESDEYDSKSSSRRNSLSISALLNDDSIDPILPTSRPLTPDEKKENRKTWPGFLAEDVPKPKRKRTSTQQFNRLMAVYQQTDTPSSEVREQLAEELDMTKREVQVWFQNRRAKASRARATAVALANSNQSQIALSQYYHSQPMWPEPNNNNNNTNNNNINNSNNSHNGNMNYLPSSTTMGSTSIYGSNTPPRRSSISQSDPSSQLLLNRPPPLSLQPIAPMPPYNNNNNNNNNNNICVPVQPPTPPFIKPITPRNHNLQQGFQNLSLHGSVPDQHHVKKRPKSAIDLYRSFDFTRPPS
ncbi:unnamed protein product [Cunninghamella blakesleeana]